MPKFLFKTCGTVVCPVFLTSGSFKPTRFFVFNSVESTDFYTILLNSLLTGFLTIFGGI